MHSSEPFNWQVALTRLDVFLLLIDSNCFIRYRDAYLAAAKLKDPGCLKEVAQRALESLEIEEGKISHLPVAYVLVLFDCHIAEGFLVLFVFIILAAIIISCCQLIQPLLPSSHSRLSCCRWGQYGSGTSGFPAYWRKEFTGWAHPRAPRRVFCSTGMHCLYANQVDFWIDVGLL